MLLALLLACLTLPAGAAELKVATWNLEWLTDRPDGDRALPQDAHPKRPEDIATLAGYAAQLDADVIAIQEVDGREIAARIFPPDRYSIRMTGDHVVQRVGLVVRRGLAYDVNPDDTALTLPGPPPAHLRSGADITLHLAGGLLRVLAVPLKTGCQHDKLTTSHRPACKTLAEQLPPLEAWITARKAEGAAFIVLGDFNRWMDDKDQVIAALREAAPLVRATEGRSSPCGAASGSSTTSWPAGRRRNGWLRRRSACRCFASPGRTGRTGCPITAPSRCTSVRRAEAP